MAQQPEGIILLDEATQQQITGYNYFNSITPMRNQGGNVQVAETRSDHGGSSLRLRNSGGKESNITDTYTVRTNFTRGGGLRHSDLDGNMTMDLRGGDDTNDAALTRSEQEQTEKVVDSSKISVIYILLGVAVGVALGVILTIYEVSPAVARWVSLPGDLFLRALKCLVVPLVFCSVAVAIGDIVYVGKVSVVGFQTAKIFLMTSFASTLLGVVVGWFARPLFRFQYADTNTPSNSLNFICANKEFLQMEKNGSIACIASADGSNAANTDALPSSVAASFVIEDVNKVFETNGDTVLADLSLSQQIIAMLYSIIPDNIIVSLANGELLAIITFSMVLGVIAGKNYFGKKRHVNYLYLILFQLRGTFFLAIEWIIWLTPVAVISIIAGSFASNQQSFSRLEEIGYYIGVCTSCAFLQMFLLYPLILFAYIGTNPFTYMGQMIPAYMFALGCSSSLATAPVTLACIKRARVSSQPLANFVVWLGVTAHTSAAGFYFPIAIIFLAESSVMGQEITFLKVVGIFGLSFLGCIGTPPIPAAGLVMLATIWKTVFAKIELPATFPLVIAADFLLDRVSTVINVNDDVMALKLIAENTDETINANLAVPTMNGTESVSQGSFNK
jgi:Na+/H+-dicarboxylate symporter